MGQRAKVLSQIFGYRGWKVVDVWFESVDGTRVQAVAGYDLPQGVRLVLRVARRWSGRCAQCGAICGKAHEQLEARRWADLPWAGRSTFVEYAPERLRCERCGSASVELVAWADRYQRQTRRLQQQLAIEAASMPIQHVAALHGLDWSTVRRAEECAFERWEKTRTPSVLKHVGVDEKYLGRRGKRSGSERFVTIVSNNETGEPLWIGNGRAETTLAEWIRTQTKEQKAAIVLFVMDMHRAFYNAVRNDPELNHAAIVHDPFHVTKRAGDALDELRRTVFFRAGPDQRSIGRGKRWLYLRSWENASDEQRHEINILLRSNTTLARGYQIAEELRGALRAPDSESMETALKHVLLRTQRRDNKALRGLHDSLQRHWPELLALAEHRPATGRVEALNNNWETLVRRARGYRDLGYLLRKLRFMVVHPIATEHGLMRFLALGLPPPIRNAA